jgi:probable HAF family extracellular repeat protein
MQALKAPVCVLATALLISGVLLAGCRSPTGAGRASPSVAESTMRAPSSAATATAMPSLTGRYVFTDLGVLPPGLDSMAFAIARTGVEDSAQTMVVGHADSGPNSKFTGFHAFVWVEAAGRMFDLGMLRRDSNSSANGVNALGQIVGESLGDGRSRAFLYDGSLHNLGGFGGAFAGAHAINDAGQVVGYAKTPDGPDHAFLWTPSAKNRSKGTLVDLGMLPDGIASVANGINAQGQVVGYSNDADSFGHAFLWSPSSAGDSAGTMVGIGGLPGEELASAYAINDDGVVVGEASIGPDAHAFAWTPTVPNGSTGTMTDLGTLGGSWSRATAINEAGDIVGVAEGPGPESFDFAFLYRDGMMYDLNSALPAEVDGVVLTTAYGITDTGQIVGGATVDQHSHAFLLTPVE